MIIKVPNRNVLTVIAHNDQQAIKFFEDLALAANNSGSGGSSGGGGGALDMGDRIGGSGFLDMGARV
jgi:hypothetical protein